MYNRHLKFHFTGIGGSGMSGLAEILLNLGFRVSGSDLKYSSVCERLASRGAIIAEGHSPENLPADASLLVYSSAVDKDNPEMIEAMRRGLPLVRRAEVLAELMRLKFGVAVAGSHGKTTTTTMIASVLEQGGLDPTVIVGGQVKLRDSGGRLGKGEYLVAETDESDRSFLLLKPTIAVVTNIDAEHLSAYRGLEELEVSFKQFISSVPFYGLAVLCIDDPRVARLSAAYEGRKVTFGFSSEADYRPISISHRKNVSTFTVEYRGQELMSLTLPLPGKHMISNALAAVAVGREFQIETPAMQTAFSSFPGVKRRMEVLNEEEGIAVMSDYGHHPTEIRATLGALRDGWRGDCSRIRVVFEPHRYSRTRDCFQEFLECFNDADELFITEIYAAGEASLEGISGESLYKSVSHPRKNFTPSLKEACDALRKTLRSGDLVLFLGAGSIGNMAEEFASSMQLAVSSPHRS